MAVKTYKSTTRLINGVKVESESRGFKVIIDEPLDLGGTDEGMNPMELLLCSLGSCQVITAAMLAEPNGIDLQEFWVETEGDLERPVVKGGKRGYTEIRYKMHIKSNSSEEKLQKFVEFIEKNCTVGNTLADPGKFVFAGIVVEK